jgi:DNA ligase (NAD+)
LVDLETQFPDLVICDSPTQRVGGKPLKAFGRRASHPDARPRQHLLEEDVKISTRASNGFASRKIPVVIEPKVDGVAVSSFTKTASCYRRRPAEKRGRQYHAKYPNDPLGA